MTSTNGEPGEVGTVSSSAVTSTSTASCPAETQADHGPKGATNERSSNHRSLYPAIDASSAAIDENDEDRDAHLSNSMRAAYGLMSYKQTAAALVEPFKVDADRYEQSGAFQAMPYWPEGAGGVYEGAAALQLKMSSIENAGRAQTLLTIMKDEVLSTNLDNDFVLSYKLHQYEKGFTSKHFVSVFDGIPKVKSTPIPQLTAGFGRTNRHGVEDDRNPNKIPSVAIRGCDPELESIYHQVSAAVPIGPRVAVHTPHLNRGRRGRPHPPIDFTRPVGPQHNYNPRYTAIDKMTHTPVFFETGHCLENHPSRWNFGRVDTFDRRDVNTAHFQVPTVIETNAKLFRRRHLVNEKEIGPLTDRLESYPYFTKGAETDERTKVPMVYSRTSYIGKDLAQAPGFGRQHLEMNKPLDPYIRPKSTCLPPTTPTYSFEHDYRFKYQSLREEYVTNNQPVYQKEGKVRGIKARKDNENSPRNTQELKAHKKVGKLASTERWQRRRKNALNHGGTQLSQMYKKQFESRAMQEAQAEADASELSLTDKLQVFKTEKTHKLWCCSIALILQALPIMKAITTHREIHRELPVESQELIASMEKENGYRGEVVLNLQKSYPSLTIAEIMVAVTRLCRLVRHWRKRKQLQKEKKMGPIITWFFIWARFSNVGLEAKKQNLLLCKKNIQFLEGLCQGPRGQGHVAEQAVGENHKS